MKEQIKVNTLMDMLLKAIEKIGESGFMLIDPLIEESLNEKENKYILNKPVSSWLAREIESTSGMTLHSDNITVHVSLDELSSDDYGKETFRELTRYYELYEVVKEIHIALGRQISEATIYGCLDYMLKTYRLPETLKRRMLSYFKENPIVLKTKLFSFDKFIELSRDKFFEFIIKLSGLELSKFDLDDFTKLNIHDTLQKYGDDYVTINKTILNSGLLQLFILDESHKLVDIELKTGKLFINDGNGFIYTLVLNNSILTSPAKLIERTTVIKYFSRILNTLRIVKSNLVSMININDFTSIDTDVAVDRLFNGYDVSGSTIVIIKEILKILLRDVNTIEPAIVWSLLRQYTDLLTEIHANENVNSYINILKSNMASDYHEYIDDLFYNLKDTFELIHQEIAECDDTGGIEAITFANGSKAISFYVDVLMDSDMLECDNPKNDIQY